MGIKIGDMVSDDMLASNMEDNTNLGLDDFNMDSHLSDPLSTDDGMGIGDNSLGGLEGFDTAGADFGLPDGMEFDDNDFYTPPSKEKGESKKVDQSSIISEELYNNLLNALRELKEILFSIETRTGDDFAEYSTNLIYTSVALGLSSFILWFIQIALGSANFFGKPFNFLCSGLLILSIGFIGLGISAFISKGTTSEPSKEFDDEPIEIPDTQEDEYIEDTYNEDYSDYSKQLDTALDNYYIDEVNENESDKNYDYDIEEVVEPEHIDYDKIIDSINSKLPNNNNNNTGEITRETLCDIFMPLFQPNTPGFKDTHEIDPSSRDFACLDLCAKRAIASAAKKDVADIVNGITEAKESLFAYIFRFPRIKSLNKPSVIEAEIIRYFTPKDEDNGLIRCDGKDDGVAVPQAKVTIEGDEYKIIVTKGEKALVTYGDIFSLPDVVQFFKNKKNAFPIVLGTTEIGLPIAIDAKANESMLLAGLSRSGKSWGVLNILLSLMLFNTPEDIQILVIDPKDTNLFATIGCFPQVIGVHNHHNILNLLDEIIDNEAEKRRRLIKENGCENIWDLKKKGVKLPLLYIFIDEFSTVTKSLGDSGAKEFNGKLKVILTQFPSLGIRLIVIAHRPVGDLDKTVRFLFQHRCVFRASVDTVKEVMDADKSSSWNTPLTQAGEAALKLQSMQGIMFMRGLSVTTSDEENKDIILACAKMYYKLGIKGVYSDCLKLCNNRDEQHIRQMLGITEGDDEQ